MRIYLYIQDFHALENMCLLNEIDSKDEMRSTQLKWGRAQPCFKEITETFKL